MTVYAGLDVSKDETAICIRDESGHILWEGKVASNGVHSGLRWRPMLGIWGGSFWRRAC